MPCLGHVELLIMFYLKLSFKCWGNTSSGSRSIGALLGRVQPLPGSQEDPAPIHFVNQEAGLIDVREGAGLSGLVGDP